jgi:DNA-binding transcriptional ArsR family regulator
LEQSDSLVIKDPVAVRYLGDAQKRRILREFMKEPKTALQAARSIGMRPPTMYHHVTQLTQVGLLILVEERRKRGTVEKYLQTPARQMTGAATLGDVDQTVDLIRDTFDGCLAEIQATLAENPETRPPISIIHLAVAVSPDRLEDFLARFQESANDFGGPDETELNLMVLVHPRRKVVLE